VTETRKVWGYQMVACGKQRNERIELAEEEGNPCSSTIVGASFGPASR
jgi:hypothetical protein